MSSSDLPENMGPVMISMRPGAEVFMVLVRPRHTVGLLIIVHWMESAGAVDIVREIPCEQRSTNF